MNYNIPSFKCFIKRAYFTKNEEDGGFDECYAFAIQSYSNKVLTFHIMTDYGMLRSRVPIYEIYFKNEGIIDILPHFKQLWDCFSENAQIQTFNYLKEKRCQIVLKDKSLVWGTYMFTIDWMNNPYSEEPTDYKCGHVIKGDDGYLLMQPNNRIFWRDANFITKEFPDIKQFKIDDKFISIEEFSDKWISEDGNNYYYNINVK